MPSAGRSLRLTVDITDSDDETLVDEEEIWIDSGNEGTPDILEDDADADDDLAIVDGAAWQRVQQPLNVAPRLQSLLPSHQVLRTLDVLPNVDLTTGVSVSLIDGDFFRIKYAVRDLVTHDVEMHGWRLRRTCRVENRLRKMAGELCLLITASIHDKRPDLEKSLECISPNHIDFGAFLVVRDIIFTNQELPALRDDARFYGDRKRHVEEGRLVCRMKSTVLYDPAQRKMAVPKVVEQSIQCLSQEEADQHFAMPDEAKLVANGKAHHVERMRSAFSQRAKKGLVSNPTDNIRGRKRRRSKEELDNEIELLNELSFKESMRRHQQARTSADYGSTLSTRHDTHYMAADVCCGGGGASGGIAETDFKLAWGLDKDLGAARTWNLNWPSATTYHMDISDFFKNQVGTAAYAHAIHFSFSCRAWAWPNPYKGEFENNPDDIACTFAAPPLLRALRPRLCTFENSDGFTAIRKHRDYFNSFLKSIVDEGYNIRWRVIDLARYGNPQHRKRLIVIASCSGEVLPEFPHPTHGTEPGLKPYRTVRDTLEAITRHASLHNPRQMRRKWRVKQRRNMLPAPWDDFLPHGITTGGPTDLHPSSKREFTIRECMELMRFRPGHELPHDLCLTKMREIVGNAVPRDLMRLLYRDFYKILRKTDEKIDRYLHVNLVDEDEAPVALGGTELVTRSIEKEAPIELESDDEDETFPEIITRRPSAARRPVVKPSADMHALPLHNRQALLSPTDETIHVPSKQDMISYDGDSRDRLETPPNPYGPIRRSRQQHRAIGDAFNIRKQPTMDGPTLKERVHLVDDSNDTGDTFADSLAGRDESSPRPKKRQRVERTAFPSTRQEAMRLRAPATKPASPFGDVDVIDLT